MQSVTIPIKSKKRPFSVEEDHRLMSLVTSMGSKSWIEISKRMPGRTSKQCRERWNGHINPSIYKGPWNPLEDELIIKKQSEFGNRWADIAKLLPGRTDILVKNRWNTYLKYRSDHGDKSDDSINVIVGNSDVDGILNSIVSGSQHLKRTQVVSIPPLLNKVKK